MLLINFDAFALGKRWLKPGVPDFLTNSKIVHNPFIEKIRLQTVETTKSSPLSCAP